MFDSLRSSSKTEEVQILVEYLNTEYAAKFKMDIDFSKLLSETIHLKLPQQDNLLDCGIFLLQYAEQFFNVSIFNEF